MELFGEFTDAEIDLISGALEDYWISNRRPIEYIARRSSTTSDFSKGSIEVGVSGDGLPEYEGVRTFLVSLAQDRAVVESYVITFDGIHYEKEEQG